MQWIWKEYFEDLYNIDTQEQVAVHMCGFDGIRRSNYFGEEPIGRAEVEMRVGKLKNGKATGKDEITGEMIKGGSDRMVDWIWKLCNMAFESGGNECRNYKSISLLSVVGKIYAGILINSVHRVTGGLIDDE